MTLSKNEAGEYIITSLIDQYNRRITKLNVDEIKFIVSKVMSDSFDKLCEIQKLAWKGDDLMDQETLFALQDAISPFLLDFAGKLGSDKVDKLLEMFPHLYCTEEAE